MKTFKPLFLIRFSIDLSQFAFISLRILINAPGKFTEFVLLNQSKVIHIFESLTHPYILLDLKLCSGALTADRSSSMPFPWRASGIYPRYCDV